MGLWRKGRGISAVVSSVRGKAVAAKRQLSPGGRLELELRSQEAPHGAATTSHTFSPPGLLAFPGQGKSSNPKVGNCIISVPLI